MESKPLRNRAPRCILYLPSSLIHNVKLTHLSEIAERYFCPRILSRSFTIHRRRRFHSRHLDPQPLAEPFRLPAVVNITLANRNQLLYHAASRPGTLPDNDIWVARKRTTVLRFGVSSWYMHNKMGGNEAAFATKYALGEKAGDYAIHGGGVPVRVKGVEGVVGVVVVSGLAQHDDHMAVVEGMQELLESQKNS